MEKRKIVAEKNNMFKLQKKDTKDRVFSFESQPVVPKCSLTKETYILSNRAFNQFFIQVR